MENVSKRNLQAMNILNAAIEMSEQTKADIFVDYSPHIEKFSIRSNENGWDSERLCDFEMAVSMSSDNAERQLRLIENYLDQLRNELELEENE